MTTPPISGLPGIAPMGTIAAAGWAARDCLLLASSVVPAYRLSLLGIAMVAAVAAVCLGWWHPAAPDPELSLPLLAAALLSIEAQYGGVGIAPCLFVPAVGVAMSRAGWPLASVTPSVLLRSSGER